MCVLLFGSLVGGVVLLGVHSSLFVGSGGGGGGGESECVKCKRKDRKVNEEWKKDESLEENKKEEMG
jgi:hypothetical protein